MKSQQEKQNRVKIQARVNEKYEKPLHLEMSFDEAMRRILCVSPSQGKFN